MGMSPGFLSQRSLKAVLSSQVISGTNHRSELPAQTPASFRLPASIVLQWLAPSLSPQRSRSSCLYQPPPPKLNSNVRKKIVRHPVSAIDLQNKKVLSVIPGLHCSSDGRRFASCSGTQVLTVSVCVSITASRGFVWSAVNTHRS